MSGAPHGRLIVLGAGGHARAVADLAVACGFTILGFTDRPGAVARADVVGDDDRALALVRAGQADGVVIGIGNASLARRSELYRLVAEAALPRPSLVHPRAVVSPSCRVGDGTVVFAGSVLGACVEIGENVVVHSGVIAEHDCRVADHAYLSPGVVLSGSVTVETNAFLGAGAVVLPGVTIGTHAVVGAGAVVLGDVQSGVTVVGSPARPKAGS